MVCRSSEIRTMSLEERIKEQGERVRRLKAEQADKEQVGKMKKVVVLGEREISGEEFQDKQTP